VAASKWGILREMAQPRDDDDWVGEPPEGHYTRDRAKPEFWRRNWPVAAASSGLLLVLILVVLVLAVK